MNPDDLARLGVEPGGAVTVGLDGIDLVLAARPDPDCPRGAAYLACDEAWAGRLDGRPAEPREPSRAGGAGRASSRPARDRRGRRCRRGRAERHGREAVVVPVVERRMIVPNVHVLTVEAPEVAEVGARPATSSSCAPTSRASASRSPSPTGTPRPARSPRSSSRSGASTAKLARLKAGDAIPSYAGPLGNETEIARFGTVLLIGGCYGIGEPLPDRARAQGGRQPGLRPRRGAQLVPPVLGGSPARRRASGRSSSPATAAAATRGT